MMSVESADRHSYCDWSIRLGKSYLEFGVVLVSGKCPKGERPMTRELAKPRNVTSRSFPVYHIVPHQRF